MRTGKRRQRAAEAEDHAPPEGAGRALFEQLARAVVALAEQEGLRSFSLPYPPHAQRALDRAVLRCLDLGETPPKSLPELLEWCRGRPAGDRLFQVPASLVSPDATLVHPVWLMPTRTCVELASHGPEGTMEGQARALLSELAERSGSTERLRRCRQFLARHPLVQQRDRFDGGWSLAVWTRVKDLYRPPPESLVVERTLLRCLACGLPALLRGRKLPTHGAPTSGPDSWCEGEVCPPGGDLELIRESDQALLLQPSLRAFLALPHSVEEEALDELDRAKIGYRAVSGELCAYRLDDIAPGTIDVQVYDRLQPALLAARCAEATTALASRTFVVVPLSRARRAGYRETFTASLPTALRARLLLTTPGDLVRHVHETTGGGRSAPTQESREPRA